MNPNMELRHYLLRKNPVDILLFLSKNKNVCVYRMSSKLSITTSYAYFMIKLFEKHKLVESKKRGRSRYASLTPRGEAIIKQIEKLVSDLETS